MMQKRHVTRAGALLGATLAIALAVSGCGAGAPGAVSEAAGTTSPEHLAAAARLLDQGRDIGSVDFPIPDMPIPPGEHRVAVISAGQKNLLANRLAAWSVEAVTEMGWTASPVFDAGLDPARMAGFIDQAVNEGYDAIMMSSIDPRSLAASIDGAAAAGVPVSCINCSSKDFEGKVIAMNSSLELQGQLIAAYMMQRSDGAAKVMEFPDSALPTGVARFDAINGYLEANCPGCTVDQTEFSIADLSRPGPPQFSSMLASSPVGAVTDVVAPYGTAAVNFARTAQSAGRTDVTVSSIGTTEDTMLLTSQGELPLGGTIVAANEYFAWSAVDLIGRQLAGLPLWDGEGLPVAIAVQGNAEQFLPDGTFQPANVEYQAVYSTLWAG